MGKKMVIRRSQATHDFFALRFFCHKFVPAEGRAGSLQIEPADDLNPPEPTDASRAHSFQSWLFVTGWFCLAIASQSGIAAGQELPAKSDAPLVQQPAAPGAGPVTDPQLKKQAVSLAFAMWVGIIFGGAILLTLVVMWGNRTRRLARSPLPPISKRDELWFLKPKPSTDDTPPPGPTDAGSNPGA